MSASARHARISSAVDAVNAYRAAKRERLKREAANDDFAALISLVSDTPCAVEHTALDALLLLDTDDSESACNFSDAAAPAPCNFSDAAPCSNPAEPLAAQGVAASPAQSASLTPSCPSRTTTPVHPSSSSQQTTKGSKNVARRLPDPATFTNKRWRALSGDEKLVAALEAADAAKAHAFRLTFSPRQEAALRQAAADGKNIRQMIASATAHQFRRRQLPIPAIVFAIEEAPGTNKLHIHGFYVSDTPPYLIRQCFIAAGGWKTDMGGNKQFWRKDGRTGVRYIGYSRKEEDSVKRRLNLDGVTFMNHEMRRAGRDWHAEQLAAPHQYDVADTAPAAHTIAEETVTLEDLDDLPAELAALEQHTTTPAPNPVPIDELTAEERELLEACLSNLDKGNLDKDAPAAHEQPIEQHATFPGEEMTDEECERLFTDLDDLDALDMTPVAQQPAVEPIDKEPAPAAIACASETPRKAPPVRVDRSQVHHTGQMHLGQLVILDPPAYLGEDEARRSQDASGGPTHAASSRSVRFASSVARLATSGPTATRPMSWRIPAPCPDADKTNVVLASHAAIAARARCDPTAGCAGDLPGCMMLWRPEGESLAGGGGLSAIRQRKETRARQRASLGREWLGPHCDARAGPGQMQALPSDVATGSSAIATQCPISIYAGRRPRDRSACTMT